VEGEKSVLFQNSKRIRVTLVLPEVLDQNIEAYATREGRMKSYVVAAALEQFLHSRGIQPGKPPQSPS
jgi:hypothetical protein